jgi:hypothetical protein
VSSPDPGPVRQGEKKTRQEREDSQERLSQMNPPSKKKEKLKRDPKRNPEIPTELGFQKVRYLARNGEPHNSSDGHRRLRENPENQCNAQENAATKFTQSRCFNEKGKSGIETRIYHLPQKSLASLGSPDRP